eukprot:g2633.t1
MHASPASPPRRGPLGTRIRCCAYTFNMGNNANLEITDLLVPVVKGGGAAAWSKDHDRSRAAAAPPTAGAGYRRAVCPVSAGAEPGNEGNTAQYDVDSRQGGTGSRTTTGALPKRCWCAECRYWALLRNQLQFIFQECRHDIQLECAVANGSASAAAPDLRLIFSFKRQEHRQRAGHINYIQRRHPHRFTRDLVFFSFAETQSALTPFVKQWKQYLYDKGGFDICEQTNARLEHQDKFGGGLWQSFAAKIATNINGNLKTLLLAKGQLFEKNREVNNANQHGGKMNLNPRIKKFFGICPENELVPNPKKAFTGRVLKVRHSKLKILCIGAHFPIGKIAKLLEAENCDDHGGEPPGARAPGTSGTTSSAPSTTTEKRIRVNARVNVVSASTSATGTTGAASAAPATAHDHQQSLIVRSAATLEQCKYVMARNLRRMLARAAEADLLDNDTLVMLSGDVNSRTLLLQEAAGGGSTSSSTGGEHQLHHQREIRTRAVDLLTETLRDRRYCAAIQNRLVHGQANWIDLSTACGTNHFVTYKFHEQYEQRVPLSVEDVAEIVAGASSSSGVTKMKLSADDTAAGMAGRTTTAATSSSASAAAAGGASAGVLAASSSGSGAEGGSDLYETALDRICDFVGPNALYKDRVEEGKRFRRFHFPAAADRVILFQPRGGAVDKLHIDELDVVPVGEQKGSDHKPLAVFFDLYVRGQLDSWRQLL